MAFPQDWTRRTAVTIPAAKVSGTSGSLSNFPVLLTEASLPSEMFDADGSDPAQNGGGDIRASSDVDGTNRLAIDVVDFTTDNDPANGSAEIWVKVPALDKASDTTIYIWHNAGGGRTQPAATDPLGRNAVWADYERVYHLGEDGGLDSSGNGTAETVSGAPATATGVFGWGTATDFDGTDDEIDLGTKVISGSEFAIQAIVKPDAIAGNHLIFGSDDNPGGLAIWLDNNGFVSGRTDIISADSDVGGARVESTTSSMAVGVAAVVHWSHTDSVDGSKLYIDGVLEDTVNGQPPQPRSDDHIGKHGGFTIPFDGLIQEVRVRSGAGASLTADWLSTEANNFTDPGTFATAGAVEDVGGGSQALAAASIGHALSAGQAPFAQTHFLSLGATVHGLASPTAGLSQDHQIAAIGTRHSQTPGSTSFVLDNSLAAVAGFSAHTGAKPAVFQAHVYAGHNGVHALVTQPGQLGQHQFLPIAEPTHGTTATEASVFVFASAAAHPRRMITITPVQGAKPAAELRRVSIDDTHQIQPD